MLFGFVEETLSGRSMLSEKQALELKGNAKQFFFKIVLLCDKTSNYIVSRIMKIC